MKLSMYPDVKRLTKSADTHQISSPKLLPSRKGEMYLVGSFPHLFGERKL